MELKQPPVEYQFSGINEEEGYRIFPEEIENNPTIFYHGTSEKNLRLILAEGFKSAYEISGREEDLKSVSFARKGHNALEFACRARNVESPRGAIIVVSFDEFRTGVTRESGAISINIMDPPPKIVGYCVISANYRFT